MVEVPVGTVLVSELPSDSSGKTDQTAEPGWYALKDNPALSGTDITNPKQGFGEFNQPNVTFGFTDKGREAFQDVTRRIAQRGQAQAIGPVSAQQAGALSGHFAVVLDNEVKTRPIINFAENPDGIDGRTGAQISGGFNSIQEAQELATILQIGALPIDLKLISQTQVSATLGSQALHDGIKAGIIGLALVVLFLLLFYRFLGLIATVALGAYGVIFFALIKLIPITLTLPGIAGLILTIGVAADSNIVIFERIKEEVRAGRSMSSAISAGYKRGIATIVDANVVTLLTAFILFVLATAGVKGFAFTLGVGTIVSLLTAVVFTQALLGSMSRTRLPALPRRPRRLRQGACAGTSTSWAPAAGSSRCRGCILIVGALALATKQLNFGIDFESGTRVEGRRWSSRPTRKACAKRSTRSGSAARRSSRSPTRSSATTSSRSRPGAGAEPGQGRQSGARLQVRHRPERLRQHQRRADLRPAGGEQRPEGADLLAAGDLRLRRAALRPEVRGAGADRALPRHPDHGGRLLADRQGGEQRNGRRLPHHLGLLALRHDHRLRPHPREHAADAAGGVLADRQPLDERGADPVAGDQLHDPARRSARCSIFGGATLQDFAFAMLVGIASGTYSSIFIASPVLTAWKEREPGFARRRQRIAEVEGRVPAFADEIELAKLGDDSESDEQIAAGAQEAQEPRPSAVATVERPGDGDRDGPSANGEPPAAADPASAERRERNEERRARRAQRRRKHGRNR